MFVCIYRQEENRVSRLTENNLKNFPDRVRSTTTAHSRESLPLSSSVNRGRLAAGRLIAKRLKFRGLRADNCSPWISNLELALNGKSFTIGLRIVPWMDCCAAIQDIVSGFGTEVGAMMFADTTVTIMSFLAPALARSIRRQCATFMGAARGKKRNVPSSRNMMATAFDKISAIFISNSSRMRISPPLEIVETEHVAFLSRRHNASRS
jgi:hypothetical protein